MKHAYHLGFAVVTMAFAAFCSPLDMALAEPQPSIAMHGDPAEPRDFTHFSYVNPEATKGGRLVHGVLGGFDSLNPFIVRGRAAQGLQELSFERLMARNVNEPFSMYGLLAETIEIAPDYAWVEFQLNPKARFSDGSPVTPEDVLHSFTLLKKHARVRASYNKVDRAEKVGDRGVRFYLKVQDDRELPLILALMSVFSQKVTEDDFTSASLTPLLTSGPYEIIDMEPGRSITYKSREDYWGKDLPSRVGHFNFDEVVFEYYNDSNALFEGFKVGNYDFRYENDPLLWATGYDFASIRDGHVAKETIPFGLPKPLRAYVFNTRNPLFADQRVRAGLTLLFDFEWVNKTLYADSYKRIQSYYPDSELSYIGHPISDAERALLGEAVADIPPEILAGESLLPVTDGRGRNRNNLRAALSLFKEAGYELKEGVLVNENGQPLSFTLTVSTVDQEKLGLTYATLLGSAGIEMKVRRADSSQLEEMRRSFDFEMIENIWYNSLSPGNEQYLYWGSEAAKTPGSRNYMGISDPVIDRLIAAQVAATTREELVAASRALDRKLISGQFLLPLFHSPGLWLAYWKQIERPEQSTLYGSIWETWWKSRGD